MGASMHYSAFLEPPHVQWNHIDGPLMSWACQMHWLTLWERFCLRLGFTTLDGVAEARFSHYRQLQMRATMLHNEDCARRQIPEDRP